MWTVENRARYDRSKLRCPSDLTDDAWALARPEIPRAKRGGNKRTVDVREVMNGLRYVLSMGCQWRAIPKDLPPAAPSTSTSAGGNTTARSTGCTMRSTCDVASRRTERPVRPRRLSTAKASRALKKARRIDPPGFDGGKKIKGKKRHVLVDTQGLAMEAIVHAADIQDRGVPRGERRDRKAMRYWKVRGAAKALGRRAHHRLAQPMPPPEQRLGVPEPQRTRVPPLGVSAADAATPLPEQAKILDRL